MYEYYETECTYYYSAAFNAPFVGHDDDDRSQAHVLQLLCCCYMMQFNLYTLCPPKMSPLNILQQPPQTCTDLNEILHTQDDIYFCHRRQIS